MNQVFKSLKKLYLLFQPVVVLDNACHYHISALHVESDLSCRLILEDNYLFAKNIKKDTNHFQLA